MKLSELSSADLQKLVKLTTEREGLVSQLTKIEDQINSFVLGVASRPRRRGRPPQPRGLSGALSAIKDVKGRRGPKKGEKPGHLKQAILGALQAAGGSGLSVGELSEKLHVKTNNLYSWFYTTGRKITKIRRNEEGKYVFHS